jgi:hypothetical protein
MRYVSIIWAAGLPAPEDLAVIQRELPAWVQDVNTRGIRLIGRELDLPDTAVTVRVRDGETLVTDGPFAETKELIGGIMLVQVRSIDEAIEWAARLAEILESEVEVRPVVELSDFDDVLPPEEIARQQQTHDRLGGT